MTDTRDPRIAALIAALAGASPAAPTYRELEESRDAVAPQQVRPEPPRRTRPGWLVASVTAAAALVVGVAVYVLTGAGPETSTPPATAPATTLPPVLPDLDAWSWTRVDGDDNTLPIFDSVKAVGGRLLAIENVCSALGDSCEPRAWVSDDGQAWTEQAPPSVFEGSAVHLFGLGDETWALVGAPQRTSLFRLLGDEWVEVALPPGPNGDEASAEGFVPAPARLGDRVIVAGYYGGTPALWTSLDGGTTFHSAALPAPDWIPRGIIVRPDSFIVYGGSVNDGAPLTEAGWAYPVSTAEVLVSGDGDVWSSAGIASFLPEVTPDLSHWSYRIYGEGPHVAVVSTGGLEDADEFWLSTDGLEWISPPGLAELTDGSDPGTAWFYTTEFGLVLVDFRAEGSLPPEGLAVDPATSPMRVLVSADGWDWADLSDPEIHYPFEAPGNVDGGMGHEVVDGLVIISRYFETGERTIWVGRFEG